MIIMITARYKHFTSASEVKIVIIHLSAGFNVVCQLNISHVDVEQAQI
jgi:hypothetical protein